MLGSLAAGDWGSHRCLLHIEPTQSYGGAGLRQRKSQAAACGGGTSFRTEPRDHLANRWPARVSTTWLSPSGPSGHGSTIDVLAVYQRPQIEPSVAPVLPGVRLSGHYRESGRTDGQTDAVMRRPSAGGEGRLGGRPAGGGDRTDAFSVSLLPQGGRTRRCAAQKRLVSDDGRRRSARCRSHKKRWSLGSQRGTGDHGWTDR